MERVGGGGGKKREREGGGDIGNYMQNNKYKEIICPILKKSATRWPWEKGQRTDLLRPNNLSGDLT